MPRPGQLSTVFASLVGSQIGAAVLGLAFWTIAARTLSPEQVGIGAGLVAAMTLLSTVGVLGVGTLLLERFKLTPTAERRALFTTGICVSVLGGAVVTGGWLGLSSLLSVQGALGNLSVGTALLLIGATGLSAACISFDQAVIGLNASSIQLRRNILASALRIVIFVIFVECGIRTGQAILIAWAAGLLGSLIASPVGRHLSARARVSTRTRWQLVRGNWMVAVGHHGLTLALGSSSLMLPVVVALMMPAAQTAYFASARLFSETALGVLYFLTIALFATIKDERAFRAKAPRTLLVGLVLALGLILGAALLGRLVLTTFGAAYAQAAFPLLLLLLAAGPALLIKEHFVVLRRVQGLRTRGAVVMGCWTAVELAGAITGGLLGGVQTLCLGWTAATTACALTLLPGLVRTIRFSSAEERSSIITETNSSRDLS